MSDTIFELIDQVQAVGIARPTVKTMLQDIKLMNIRIRPVEGDLFILKHIEPRFIRSLWKVSKINYIASKAAKMLPDHEAAYFFSYLDSLEPEGGLLEQPAPQNMPTLLVEVFRHEQEHTHAN